MIRGTLLESILDPDIIRSTLSKLAKVEDVRLVRQHESRVGSKPMRDFAFVEFASITESKKVHDFVSKYGLLLEGSEVSVIYCRGNKPITDQQLIEHPKQEIKQVDKTGNKVVIQNSKGKVEQKESFEQKRQQVEYKVDGET